MERLKRLLFRIIEKLAPEIAENVKGDLEELYQRASESKGKLGATVLLVIEFITCFKLILNHNGFNKIKLTPFTTDVKMSWRVLVKNPSYSVVSLLGLTLGLTASLMIFIYVHNELNYDRHHQKANRIYRLVYDLTDRSENLPWAIITGKWAPMITDQYSEVENFVRITPTWGSKSLIKTNQINTGFYEEGFMWADSTFTSIFDLEWLVGDRENPIAKPNSIIINEEIAVKYFGGVDNAIGNVINRDNETDYIVTAVFKNMPSTSHFHAQMIASIMTGTTEEERDKFWNYSYVVLKDGAKPDHLNKLFPKLVSQHIDSATLPRLYLQPLTSIYLDSQLMYEFEPVGNKSTVRIFIGVGFFILFIACINFINLSTAYGAKRTKEIGIKKVLGAHRFSLLKQLVLESALITMIGIGFAVVLSILLFPYTEALIGKQLDLSHLYTLNNIAILLGFVFLIGFLSGAYPALYVSSHKPVNIFAKASSGGRPFIRKALSVIQFMMSIALIAGSITVYKQLQYFQSKDTGIQPEQVLVVPLDYAQNIKKDHHGFKAELEQHSGIKSISLMSSLPGELIRMWVGDIRLLHGTDEDKLRVKIFDSDYDFIETLGLQIVKGRDYSRDYATDTTRAVLINETAAKALGITNLDTTSIYTYSNLQNKELKVIGIVKDFHFASLHNIIEPLVIYNRAETDNKTKMVVRIDTKDLYNTLSYIEETWGSYEPDRTFESYFLDAYFQSKYTKEQTAMKLLIIFTFLAIFIACLGLFGLATYVLQNRQKEVSVRKVLGASVGQLWLLLTREFVWLILISFFLVSPLVYYLMENWLSDFAYRIDIDPLIFLFSILIVLVPALFSVSFKSMEIAKVNPKDVLSGD